jgi:subtilase family serine protease
MNMTRVIKMSRISLVILMLVNVCALELANAGEEAEIYNPSSSIANRGDAGFSARTHFKVLIPPGGYARLNNEISPSPMVGPPSTLGANIGYDTPGSLACRYGLTTATVGCSAKDALNVPSGGSGAIAVVLAYHYPNALKDLTAFSSQFGLPVPNLKVVYASGLTTPPANSPANWELEGALDLQWAHAMAPNAQLILVEANTNANADLLKAIDVATQQLAAGSGGQVNMSWGSAEFSAETTATYENHFAANPFNPSKKPIVYFASSGDGAGTSWPCVSPNVVCVGGTTVRKNPVTGQTVASLGNQSAEVAWNSGGGGVSAYFSKPTYQNVNSASSTMREVPDVALAADPLTGAWVYYTNSSTKASGWYVVGGTSWSSPAFAAIVNNKSSAFALNSATLLNNLYQRRSTYTDVQSGWCGSFYSLSASPGWDNCTGVGLPNANFLP